MTTLSVLYPREEGASFDFDYYEKVHLPLVGRLWADAGLTVGGALRGTRGVEGGEAPFFAIGFIHFESANALAEAMSGPHAPEILGDIRKFTSVTPLLQINEEIAAVSG